MFFAISKRVMFAGVFVLSMGASAADFHLEAGFHQQAGEVTATTANAKSQVGYQFGGIVNVDMGDAFGFRTGMMYVQRPLVSEVNGSETKYDLNYFDIPLTAQYRFADYASVFAGLNLALNIDANASRGSVTDVKTPIMPFVLGATFKFAPQLGGTIYYETMSGDVANGLKNYRAVGFSLGIYFN